MPAGKPGKQKQGKQVHRGFGLQQRTPVATVTNSELVTTLTPQAGNWAIMGKANGYALNPGSSYTFPWLSKVAHAYEKYRFRKLTFTLKSGNSCVVSGMAYMSIDSDTTDPAPTEAGVMMGCWKKASGVCHSNHTIALSEADCAKLHNQNRWAYVKEKSGADQYPRSSTVGRLYLAAAVNENCTFELHVSYTVEFSEPQVLQDVTVRTSTLVGNVPLVNTAQPVTIKQSNPPVRPIVSVATPTGAYYGLDIDRVGETTDFAVSCDDLTSSYGCGEIIETPIWRAFDKNGNALGNLEPPAASGGTYTQLGVANLFQQFVDGYATTLSKREVFRAFPEAKFVVPLIRTAVAAAADLYLRMRVTSAAKPEL